MFGNLSQKLYVPDPGHPVFTRIYRDEKSRQPSRENNKHLIFAAIDRYWPVPRQRWHPQAGESAELMTLPNARQIGDYADETNRILRSLPLTSEKNARFKARLEEHQRVIKNALLIGGDLYKLVNPLDALLNDSGEADNPARPNLQEFWQAAEQADLREQLAKLLETVRYGDPYLVARTMGKGRVLAYLSTANTDWNDMPSGPSRIYWVMLMVEMQKYMASNTADVNLTLGTPLDVELDAARYDATMQRFAPPRIDYGKGGLIKYVPTDLRGQPGETAGNKLTFHFTDARVPGVYEFILTRKDSEPAPMGAPAPKPGEKAADSARQETIAYAYNVDAVAESNLKRVSADEFSAVSGNLPLHNPDDPVLEALLKDKKSDFSESPLLYLLLLIVLIAEQAMAVRLSFHSRAHEASPTYSSPTSAVAAVEPAAALPVG
jgi:hypothetical protein